MFLKEILEFVCPPKVEKTTHQSCSEKLKSTFFPLLPAQPKWPKQKNSYSKMWLIDQLYIELGLEEQDLSVRSALTKISIVVVHNCGEFED